MNNKENFLHDYATFRKDRSDAFASLGGVMIIVDKSLPCHLLNIQTVLVAMAFRVLRERLIRVCSFDMPRHYNLNKQEFQSFVELREP